MAGIYVVVYRCGPYVEVVILRTLYEKASKMLRTLYEKASKVSPLGIGSFYLQVYMCGCLLWALMLVYMGWWLIRCGHYYWVGLFVSSRSLL